MKGKSLTVRILRSFAKRKKQMLFLISLVIIASAMDVGVPFVSQHLIDTLINFFSSGSHEGSAPYGTLFMSGFGILALTAATRGLRSVYDLRWFELVTKAEDELRHQAYEKYLRLHSLYHNKVSSGQIISRIDRGTGAVYNIINDIFGQNLLPPLLVFIGVFISLFLKNIWVAAAVAAPIPVYILSIRRLSGRLHDIEVRTNREFEDVGKEAYDVAGNVATVKRFSQEKREIETQKNLLKRARETQMEANRLWHFMENVQTAIATTGRIGVILLSGFMVLSGKSTVGEFVLYITLQGMVYGPITQLSSILPNLERNLARAESLFQIMDEPLRVRDRSDAMPLAPLSCGIEFRHVWFRYSRKKGWTLKDIDFEIPAGSTVALVGRSGSGKTTFANLLLRSFDPQRGSIIVDGVDMRSATQESLRSQIGIVPQEADLFARTISENISYGKPDASMEEVVQAAKTAQAHDFIMGLEKGYDTVVGERGARLSGGERQRIGIARAILRDPRILILDEATSHLDTYSERLIQKATDVLVKGRTTVIIAHRLSTILSADKIIVFKGGEIEAGDRHDRLLEISPTYQNLYSMQFAP
jgi:ABC-type multidrug transport system fused ATPase/permease subunit